MTATTSLFLPKSVQGGLIQYHKQCYQMMTRQWNLREQMRKIDLNYIREADWTQDTYRARLANAAGDSDKIQNVTIPVIKPQINAACAYQCAVFLTDYPLFGVVGDPTYEDAALQMQALIEENSIRGAWVRELMLFFIDGFKYNLSALEVYWDKIVTAAIETDLSYKGGVEGKPKEIIWAGNCMKRWDLYNSYWDTRVLPYEIPSKGEFAGHTELYSRTALKTLINSLDSKLLENIKAAFESPSMLNVGSGTGVEGFYIPQINPEALLNVDPMETTDWMSWAALSSQSDLPIQYKNIYEVSTEYIRIIPADFGLKVPAQNTPQVWKQIIVNHSVVIYAERQTNAHEKLPVFFGSPGEDGLGYQTKSLASDALPFQQVSSALLNGVMAARRRAVGDRILYDPSRVSEAHMNSPSPTARIPTRPSAYGKPVSESVYQFPYRDDQSAIAMQEISSVVQFGNVLNGQNQARQGQFVKGNKTDSQWEGTMSNATSKDQMTALLYEAQVFTPVKEVLKLNYLQYQGNATIYSPSQKQNVAIDPIALRKAVINFKVTDGLTPKEKVMSSDARKVAMQVLGSSPALAQGYNIAPLFSYIMKTENVDLSPFEKSPAQMQFESASAAWNNLAQLSIQKGLPFNIPQPKPMDYGFDPNAIDPRSQAESQGTSANSPAQLQQVA